MTPDAANRAQASSFGSGFFLRVRLAGVLAPSSDVAFAERRRVVVAFLAFVVVLTFFVVVVVLLFALVFSDGFSILSDAASPVLFAAVVRRVLVVLTSFADAVSAFEVLVAAFFLVLFGFTAGVSVAADAAVFFVRVVFAAAVDVVDRVLFLAEGFGVVSLSDNASTEDSPVAVSAMSFAFGFVVFLAVVVFRAVVDRRLEPALVVEFAVLVDFVFFTGLLATEEASTLTLCVSSCSGVCFALSLAFKRSAVDALLPFFRVGFEALGLLAGFGASTATSAACSVTWLANLVLSLFLRFSGFACLGVCGFEGASRALAFRFDVDLEVSPRGFGEFVDGVSFWFSVSLRSLTRFAALRVAALSRS